MTKSRVDYTALKLLSESSSPLSVSNIHLYLNVQTNYWKETRSSDNLSLFLCLYITYSTTLDPPNQRRNPDPSPYDPEIIMTKHLVIETLLISPSTSADTQAV